MKQKSPGMKCQGLNEAQPEFQSALLGILLILVTLLALLVILLVLALLTLLVLVMAALLPALILLVLRLVGILRIVATHEVSPYQIAALLPHVDTKPLSVTRMSATGMAHFTPCFLYPRKRLRWLEA